MTLLKIARLRWEINFLLNFETAQFFCVYPVYRRANICQYIRVIISRFSFFLLCLDEETSDIPRVAAILPTYTSHDSTCKLRHIFQLRYSLIMLQWDSCSKR